MNVFLVSFVMWDIFMFVFVVLFYVVYCDCGCEYFFGSYCWLMRGVKDFVKIGIILNFYVIIYDCYIVVLYLF